MTAEYKRKQASLNQLELQLKTVATAEPRIDLIDQALAAYVYINPDRAEALLREQDELLSTLDLPDARLSYYVHLAALKNQQYHFAAAEAALLSALKLVEEYGSISQRIDLYIDYAGNLINQHKMRAAEEYLETTDRLLENFPDDELRARVDCRYGALHLNYNSYAKAMQYYLQALTVIGSNRRGLTLKGHYFYTLINTGLGNVYERTGEPDKAIDAYQRTISRCEDLGLRGRLAWHYLNLGNAYWSAGDRKKAGKYFSNVLENKADASRKARAAALANLGGCYIQQKKYAEAEKLVDEAEKIYRELDESDYANSATMAVYRARIREKQKDLPGSIRQLELAVDLADQAGDPMILSEIFYGLGRLYAETGDYRSAYMAQLQYDDYQLKYREQLNSRLQRELEAKYQSEAKEKEAERLKLKAGQLQLRALRAQMNPHFLYNCLNSIQSFITTNRASTASKYLAKFAMLMRQSLEYTNVEYISLEDEIAFLSDYLEISCHLRFEGLLDYKIKVDDELEEDILGVPTMIIQPYVENAIEHGLRGRKQGKIDISFFLKDETTIQAIIEDNGIGRRRVAQIQAKDPARSQHRSRGTEITLSRLRLLRGAQDEEDTQAVVTTDLLSADGEPLGTRVEVSIPVVDLQLIKYS